LVFVVVSSYSTNIVRIARRQCDQTRRGAHNTGKMFSKIFLES
jgi:hypothetical protein